MCKNRGTSEKPITEEQVWKKVLVIKKDRGSLNRSDSGGREPHTNRFAAFSNQLHQDEGTGIQLDRTLCVNPSCNVEDGGESSCQQKEEKKVGAKVSNTSNKGGAKGGKNSIDGKGEVRKVDSIGNRITNPFFSIKKQADSSAGPSRFRFTTRSKDDPSVKESPCILTNKDASEQASDMEGRRGETPQNRQRWTRKSTRYASKGKKGRPPITLLNLEDALLQSCNGSKKRKKVTETMHPSIMELPQDGGNERNEKDMVLDTESTVSEVIMDRYHTYRYVTNAAGPDGVVRVLCMWKEDEMDASHVVAHQNWIGVSFRRLSDNKAFVVFGVYLPPRLKEVDDNHKRFTWSNHRQGQDSVQFKATKKTMTTIKVILQDFDCLAGMRVNMQKSMIFARTMVDCHMGDIQSILPWSCESLPSDYLGLPLFLGNLTEDLCLPLLTKVEKRLAGWKAQMLSYAGRLCLIRYVLMTLPYYWMMAFRLPKVVLKRIEQACIKFLWNEEDGSRHMHLVKWERLCLPLDEGGVGIRRLEDVNRAMLASRCCRLLISKDPWANIYKEKYLSSHSLWTLNRSSNPSWGWKGLRWGWSWLQNKVEWKVGNGDQIRLWKDRWAGQVLINRVDGNGYVLLSNQLNISIRQVTCANQESPTLAMAAHLGVSSTNIRIRDAEDSLVWSDDGKASFKAGEIINKCRIQGVKESWRRKIWASYAPAKSCWYSYIACEGRLPTLDRIQKTGVQLANRCSFCYCAEETNAHVLMNCKIAREVWKYIAAKFDRVNYPRGDIADAFKRWSQAKITGKWRCRCWRMTFLIVCWNLWWLRNRCLHDNLQPHVSRFQKYVWRSCLDSFSSVKWPAEIELKLRIWLETGLDSVDSIVPNRNGMLINIVRASTRHGPKIAGLSYADNGQMGCVVIINVRGSIHQGEIEVLERILRFHKDYGGDYIIVSPIKDWVRKTRQRLEGRRPLTSWNRYLDQLQKRIFVKQGAATVDIGRLIMDHANATYDYFANLKMYMHSL
ncbi:putative ribonuclease H protein [Nymphaea thermarum]|nr:putative ribonuclease H protein [Nymphaea thermarum]